MRLFTKEEDKFLRDNYLTMPTKRMSDVLGRADSVAGQRMKLLGLVVPPEIIEQRKKDSRFKKGQTPPNKGKKMPKELYKKCKATMFKKGTVPPNHQTVGYERMTIDGYTEIKTGEGLRMFRLKHRVEWEKVNGKIPKGMILVCKSDNKQDCSPSNWELITRAQNMQRNTYHNYPKEIANLIQLRGALNRQINKKQKQLHEK